MLVAIVIGPQAAAQDSTEEFDATFGIAPKPQLPLQVEAGAVDLVDIDPAQGGNEAPMPKLDGGTASYYGRRFHGRLTASGETFDMNAFTAAHPSLPFGSMVRVTNPRNSRSVIVRINDRGPFVEGRVIDLSRAAAKEIGLIRRGHAEVELELVAS